MIPQRLFRDVAGRAGIDADDARAAAEGLDRLGVGGIEIWFVHPPGHQVDRAHSWLLGQRAGQLDDVFGLPAGVRVTPQLQIEAADQAVDADQADAQWCLGIDIRLRWVNSSPRSPVISILFCTTRSAEASPGPCQMRR